MFALVAGAGTVGSYVALSLLSEGHQLAMIDKDPEVVASLPPTLLAATVTGDASDTGVLERAGVRRADIAVATTGADEDNLAICFLAKHEYQVSRTVARVNHPANTWLYGKDMGVDVAISQAHIMSHLIQAEVEVGELITLLRLQEGEVSLVEETIASTSAVVGRAIGALAFPSGAVPVAVVRSGRVLVPTADVRLEAGDRLLALARADQESAIGAALQ